MKKRILLISILMWVMSAVFPQAGAIVSGRYTFDFEEEQELPRLRIVNFHLEDANNLHREVTKVYAKESYNLKVKVENVGVGTAKSFTTIVEIKGEPANQLSYNRQTVSLSTIKSGASDIVEIPIVANSDLQAGTISVRVRISDPGDYTEFKKLDTYKYDPPKLTFDNLCIVNEKSSDVEKKDGDLKRNGNYSLNFSLKNDSYSNARNLRVEVEFSKGMQVLRSAGGNSWSKEIASIHGYNTEKVSIPFWVPEDYPNDKVSVSVKVSSSTGAPLYKNLVCYIEENGMEDIDKNIPVVPRQDNRFAIVIGNQNYDYSYVKYAKEDARSFIQYSEKVLGVKPENIWHYDDLSSRSMAIMIDEVCEELRNMPSGCEVFFYYSGHAVCREDSSACLLPIDVLPNEAKRGCCLRELYAKLSGTGASLVTVFLDACYTGAGRNEDYLALGGEKGHIDRVPVMEEVPGNTVVFSASQKEEAAYTYDDAGHGIFTYCLLSELKKNPEQTYNDLYDNVKKKVVELSSELLKDQEQEQKKQTPSIQVSNAKHEDWKKENLKFN